MSVKREPSRFVRKSGTTQNAVILRDKQNPFDFNLLQRLL
jgi:hypothetical protein